MGIGRGRGKGSGGKGAVADTRIPADEVMDIEVLELLTWAVKTERRFGAPAKSAHAPLAQGLIERADAQLEGGMLHPVDARLIQIVRDELAEALTIS